MAFEIQTCDVTLHPGVPVKFESDENVERLIAVFGDVWHRIPLPHRSAMWTWWRTNRHCDGTLSVIESRVLIPSSPEQEDYALAAYFHYQNRIRLRQTWLRTMPDDVLATLIAHELSHAFIASAGKSSLEYSDEEVLVHHFMPSWGYFDQHLKDWQDRNSYQFECGCNHEITSPINAFEYCARCFECFDVILDPKVQDTPYHQWVGFEGYESRWL